MYYTDEEGRWEGSWWFDLFMGLVVLGCAAVCFASITGLVVLVGSIL